MAKSHDGKILLTGDSADDADWENVLNSIDVEKLPIKYLTSLRLNLLDNSVFVIDVASIFEQTGNADITARKVNDLIKQRKLQITFIDFTLDVRKLKSGITKAKNKFTKKVNFNIKRGGKAK